MQTLKDFVVQTFKCFMDFVLNVGVWRLNMIVRIVKYYVDGVLNMDNL